MNRRRIAAAAFLSSILTLPAAGQGTVDVNKLPMAGLSSDGVHPNDQGYTYMAGIWYAAIKDLLPK